MIFKVRFWRENSGNCTTTFREFGGKRFFNRIEGNCAAGGKWCTVNSSGDFWESDTPVRDDVIFEVVDRGGNLLFTESNATLDSFQSVRMRARQEAKIWATKLNLRPYEEWKAWLAADMEKHGYSGYIDNWLHAETGDRGCEKLGRFHHLGKEFRIYSDRIDHIICGKEWRYIYVYDVSTKNTEALCGFIF